MIKKAIKWLWEPNFAFGECCGFFGIVYTAAALLTLYFDPTNRGFPWLGFAALIFLGLAVHHMELLKGEVKP